MNDRAEFVHDDADQGDTLIGKLGAVPTATSLRAALDDALASTPHLPRDRAAIALARRYADLLDDATDRLDDAAEVLADTDGQDGARDFGRMVTVIIRLGPRLESVLDRLGMTPGARRGEERNVPDDPAADVLAGLRAAYDATRVDPAAAVDEAVTAAIAGD